MTEEEIKKAVYTVFEECHLVVEPSAAAAVAALFKWKPRKTKEQIAIVISGGNISIKFLSETLSKYGQKPPFRTLI